MKLQNPNVKSQMNDKDIINKIGILGFRHLKFNLPLGFDLYHYRFSHRLCVDVSRRKK
jgi:hypothetical protein